MLVAYGPEGQPVVAEEMPLDRLRIWSHDHALHCPNCRGSVHVRGGPDKRTQLHFAHQKGECAWSTEAESVRHMRGKTLLAQWVREQFPDAKVTLEERLPEPNRIADVFVLHANGQRWAIEFQCAPLQIEEWRHRHQAYRTAGILDLWIIGNNRREKQEAFIEAIIATAHEVLFLDPLVSPARIWLRWPLQRDLARQWQQTPVPSQDAHGSYRPTLDGWVGRSGYGATLIGTLHDVHLDTQMRILHPVRTSLEIRTRLLQQMSQALQTDEQMLATYLRSRVDEQALRVVLLPLLHAYQRDPDLLRRYNYGRGTLDQPPRTVDHQRVLKAQEWLTHLLRRGYPPEHIAELVREIPFVGPYAAFVDYVTTLLAISAQQATSNLRFD